jgi:hypothetical protein
MSDRKVIPIPPNTSAIVDTSQSIWLVVGAGLGFGFSAFVVLLAWLTP